VKERLSQPEAEHPIPTGMSASPEGSFAKSLKELRRKLVGKQTTLSTGIGCTVVAVSYWETGRRLPSRDMIARLITMFRESGATRSELRRLMRTWSVELFRRNVGPVTY
jgi:DNA-binding transcriptional regulator YiaG